MKKISQVLFVILFLYSFATKAETQVSPLCPILDLNATTEYYLEKSISRLFSNSEYEDQLIDVGIFKPVSLNDLRLLKTETDSAVCQKLNERTELPGRYRYDRELDLYVPEVYVLYYELRGQYIVFRQGYSPDSGEQGVIGPPASGWVFINVYEKTNLNYLGRVAF